MKSIPLILEVFLLASSLAFVSPVVISCGSGSSDTKEKSSEDENDSEPVADVNSTVCAAENGPFTVEIDNKYLPFQVGAVNVLEGLEGGTEQGSATFTVLDETREIGGIVTRIVEKSDLSDTGDGGAERSFYAQAPDGTVCCYGEESLEYTAGEITDTAVEWMAGEDDYLPGVAMPGAPFVGMIFEMVHGPDGIETSEITGIAETVETPAGTFADCLLALEDGPSIKKYAAGIGMIYDDGLALISTSYPITP